MGKKKRGQPKKTEDQKNYDKLVAAESKKQSAPDTSDALKELLTAAKDGEGGDPKDMLNQLLAKFLGGGMMGEPEAPQIDRDALFSELDYLVNSIDNRIDEYARLSNSILGEDFSNMADLVDFSQYDLVTAKPIEKENLKVFSIIYFGFFWR